MTPVRPFVTAAVRYWGGSLSLVQSDDADWPLFHYTPDEKRQLAALADQVGGGELALFLLVNTLIFIALAAAAVWFGFWPILKALYPDIRQVSGWVMFGLLGIVCAIMASVGVSLSMTLTAGLLSTGYQHPDLPQVPVEAIAALFQKMQRQFLLAGGLTTGAGLLVAGALCVAQGQLGLLIHTSLRLLLPAGTLVVFLYYLAGYSSRR